MSFSDNSHIVISEGKVLNPYAMHEIFQKLELMCDESEDAKYGTLSTGTVRELIQEALPNADPEKAYRLAGFDTDKGSWTREEWLPIDTAPKDEKGCDLWCIDPHGEFIPERGGVRLTDCFWHESDEHQPITGWARIMADGNYDFIEHGPTNKLGLPPWKPTHWRREPEPPTP